MTWTGTTFDTIKMIMSIEMCKIEETLEMVRSFFDKEDIKLKDMEVLIGKLQHAIKFCPGGRRFMNQLLQMRCNMNATESYKLTAGAKDDLCWYVKFLKEFNGTAIIRSQFVATCEILVDACLIGSSIGGTRHIHFICSLAR